MSARAWLSLLLLSALWGGSFLYFELTLEGFRPFTVALLRAGIGALILVAIYAARRESWKALSRHWRLMLVLGIFNLGVPHVLFAWGQQYIDSGLAAVLNAVTPLPTFLLAFCIGQEKFSLSRLGGVTLGLVGVGVLFIESLGMGVNNLLGAAAALAPAFLYATGAIMAKRYASDDVGPWGYSVGMAAVATALLLPFSLVFDRPWGNIPTDFEPWIGALGLGTVATAFAYPLFYSLIRKVGATNTVSVTLLVPVIAIIAGVVILGERFGATFFSGAALIMLSLILVDGRIGQHLRHARAFIFRARD